MSTESNHHHIGEDLLSFYHRKDYNRLVGNKLATSEDSDVLIHSHVVRDTKKLLSLLFTARKDTLYKLNKTLLHHKRQHKNADENIHIEHTHQDIIRNIAHLKTILSGMTFLLWKDKKLHHNIDNLDVKNARRTILYTQKRLAHIMDETCVSAEDVETTRTNQLKKEGSLIQCSMEGGFVNGTFLHAIYKKKE